MEASEAYETKTTMNRNRLIRVRDVTGKMRTTRGDR